MKTEDNINHPKHYETDKIECIEAMEITQGRGAVMSFCLCNAFKYLWRHPRKNGVEDIKKARWYLDKYIELAEKEDIPICKELKKVADEDLSLKIKEAFGYVDPITERLKPIWTDQISKSLDASKEEKEKLYNDMLKSEYVPYTMKDLSPTIEESIIESFARNSKDNIADAIRKDDVLSDAAKEELLKNLSDGELEYLFNADYGNGRDA